MDYVWSKGHIEYVEVGSVRVKLLTRETLKLASPTGASWNQILDWLKGIDALRREVQPKKSNQMMRARFTVVRISQVSADGYEIVLTPVTSGSKENESFLPLDAAGRDEADGVERQRREAI